MDERLEANQRNWDERATIHVRSAFYDVDGWLAGAHDREPPVGTDVLGDVSDLRLLHLQCHLGQDTLSWARAGAHVTGLDFSPFAIDTARDLAERAGLADRSRFVCADVYGAAPALDHETFDIVYVNLGALCWLPDVNAWAAQVGQLVAPGGRFFIHDGHPLAWALSDAVERRIELTYFEEPEPLVDESGSTYTDGGQTVSNRRTYEWNHGIGEIVTALIGHGLRIESLTEHDWTVFEAAPWLVRAGLGRWTTRPGTPRLPLTFSILATKPAGS